MGVCSSCDKNCEHASSNIPVNDQCFLPENIHSFFCEYNRKTIPKPPNAKWEPQIFTILCDKLFSGKYESVETLINETINQQLSPFLSQVNFFSDRFAYIVDKLRVKLHNEPIELEKNWQNTCQSLNFDKGTSCDVPFILGATFSMFFELLPEIDKISESEFDEVLSSLLDSLIQEKNTTSTGISPQLFSKFNSCLVSIATKNIFQSLSIRTKIIAFLLRVAEIDGNIATVISSINVALSIPSTSRSTSLYMPKLEIFPEINEAEFNHWNKKWAIDPIKHVSSITANDDTLFIAGFDDDKKNSLFSFNFGNEKMTKTKIEIPENCLLTIDDMSLFVFDTDTCIIKTYSLHDLEPLKTITIPQQESTKNFKIVSVCYFNTELYILRDEGGAGNYTIESYANEEAFSTNCIISLSSDVPQNDVKLPLQPIVIQLSDIANAVEAENNKQVPKQEEQQQKDKEKEKVNIKFKLTASSSISTPFMDCSLITNGHYIALISPYSQTMIKFAFECERLVAKHIPSPVICSEGSIITAFSNFSYVIEKDLTMKRFNDSFGLSLTFERQKKEFESDESNPQFSSFIETIILMLSNQLTSLIPNVINCNLQDSDVKVKKAIQFFVSQNPEETLLAALDLGEKCLDNEVTYPKSVRELIILFSLQVITCSLRFYTFRFPYDHITIHDDQFIDKNGKNVFSKIRAFIKNVTMNTAINNRSIICSAFQVVCAGFKYLYNPYYSEFTDLVNDLSKQEGKEEYIAAALPFLFGSSALIYAINENTVKIIAKYHPPSVVFRILGDQIPFINNEHFFISGHKYKVEHSIASFVNATFRYFAELLCMVDISSRKQEAVDRILQIIARILSLNNASSIILGTFGSSCLWLLKELMPKFKASDVSIKHDKILSNPLNSATKIQYESKIFETTHPYPPKQDKETPFEMCGATEIKIEFDPQCATEATTDYLQIFDKAEGGSSAYKTLTGPAGPGWPREITIQSDTCRFLFHSEESTSDWGIKCVISANVPVTETFINPSVSLLIINLICFSLGWSIEKIIDDNQANEQYNNTSSIANIEAQNKEVSFTEEEEEFLRSVADTTNVHPIVTAIRSKMRVPKISILGKKQDNEMDCLCIAAIIRQTNLIKEAMQFSKTNELAVKLSAIGRQLASLKTRLRQSSSPLPEVNHAESLQTEMRAIIINKARYFAFNEELKMQFNDFISLLKNEKPLHWFFEQREESVAYKQARSSVPTMIEDFFKLEQISHTGKISFMSQLKKSGKTAANSKETFSLLLKMLIGDIPNSLQLFILRSLITHNGCNTQQFNEILSFLINYKAQSIEEHVFEECTWLYILSTILYGRDSTQNLKEEALNRIINCLYNELPPIRERGVNTEMVEYKLTMIMSLLINKKCSFDIVPLLENYKIDTPRHLCSIIRLISCILTHSYSSIPQEFRFLGADFTISSFIVELFDFIAEPITQAKIEFKNHMKTQLENGTCLFEKFPLSSHQYISSELILCIRYMMNFSGESGDKIKNEINQVIKKALEKNQASEQLLSTFTILGGGLLPHAKGCYCMTQDGKLFCITETSPFSDDVYGFIVDTLEFTSFTKSSLISCSIIPIPKFDFTKHVKLFYDIHQTFIRQPSNFVSCMRSAVIASFYTLLPIILQDHALSSVFEKNTDFLVSLLNFANSSTNSEKFDTLPDIISTLNYFMYINNRQVKLHEEDGEFLLENEKEAEERTELASQSLLQKEKYKSQTSYTFDNAQFNQINPAIPFSMVNKKHSLSPTRMACIYGAGKVDGRVFSSSMSSLFVGDRTLDGLSPFYFEITVLQPQGEQKDQNNNLLPANMSFSIGFADTSSPTCFYQLSLPRFEVLSPTGNARACTDQQKVHVGDKFGVGYTQGKIVFFMNEHRFPISIDSPPFGEYIPFLLDKSGVGKFSVNFGQEAFMNGVLQDPLFGCERIKSKSFQYTSSLNDFNNEDDANSFDCEKYDEFIKNMIPYIDPPTDECKISNTQKKEEEIITRYILKTPVEPNIPQLSINSPVFIKRTRINPNEATQDEEINIPFESRCMFNRIGIVKALSQTNSGINATVSFYDTTTGEEEMRVINSRFLHIVGRYRFEGTDFKNKMHTESFAAEGLYYTRRLSVRASRYAILAIIYNNPMIITSLWNSARPKKVSTLFSMLNIELNEFSPLVSINPSIITTPEITPMETLCTSKLRELLAKTQFQIFTQTSQHWFFFAMMKIAIYNLSPDLQTTSNSQANSPVGSAQTDQPSTTKLGVSSKGNSNNSSASSVSSLLIDSQRDSHDALFDKTKLIHRIVSPETANSFFIDYSVSVNDSVGFIVPIHSENDVPSGVININGIDLVSLSRDVKFIPGNTLQVKGHGKIAQGRRVKFALLPISKYLPDQLVNTPIGSFHILMTTLSFYFSFLENHQLVNAKKYLRDLLPLAIKLMMSKGLISRLVAFEIIAPILTRLDWSENDEDSFGTNSDIASYMKSFNDIINDKEFLNPSAEQAILLSIMIDLNRLHSAEKAAIRDKAKIGSYLKMLLEMNSREPKTKFDNIAQSFLKVTALTHDWNFPIRFPSFLLIDDFLKRILPAPVVLHAADFVQDGERMFYQYESSVCESAQVDFTNLTNVQIGSVEAQNHSVYSFTNTKIYVPSGVDNFEIIITPKTLQGSKQLSFFESHFDEFLSLCDEMKSKWTTKMDEELLRALRSHNNEQIPDELTETDIIKSNVLVKIDRESLKIRIKLIKQLDGVMDFLVKKVDIKSQNSLLASGILSARSAIATCHKQNIFKERVNYNLKETSRIHLRFNRSRAILHMDRPDHPSAATLLRQLIEQVPLRLIDSLKRDSVPWHVDLIGEGATDAGGPSRDIFTQMCQEIVHPSTGMFICSPNTKYMTGSSTENVDRYIPNPNCKDLTMFEYAGVLMTIAYVSRMPQPFRFAEFVWRFLTGHPLTIEDIYSTDNGFESMMNAFEGNGEDLVKSAREYFFTVADASGQTRELIPNGSQHRVTEENISEYIKLAKEYRINEMLGPLEYLRKGIFHFFPPNAVSLLSSWELELFVSGDTNVSVEELKKCCKFDAKDPSSVMLWKVIEGFTPTERMLFIKFATGRMGLPSPGMSWHSPLTITWSGLQGRSDEAAELPTAQTCSSTIRIPRYTTEEAMARKIRTAFLYSGEIVNDRTQNAADIVQLS